MSPLRSEQIVTISYLRSYISLIASPPSVFLFLRPRNQPLSAVYNQIPFPFLFLPSFRVIPPRSVLTRNVFFFPPPPSLLLFLLLPLLANDRSQRPMLIVNRPPSVSLFLLPPSLPSFLSPEVCSGASEPPDGRGGSEKEREKKRNPTSWPKLFSEIRRFFRASSEMIFARINPYGRHGNRSACLVHPRRPKSGKPAARIVEWTRGVRDSNSRFRERAGRNALFPSSTRFPESRTFRPRSFRLPPASTTRSDRGKRTRLRNCPRSFFASFSPSSFSSVYTCVKLDAISVIPRRREGT